MPALIAAVLTFSFLCADASRDRMVSNLLIIN